MHAISDVATDPGAWKYAEYQGNRVVLYGTRNGVEIKVVVDRNTRDIVTGHPVNLPKNP
jgi:hypothetical protein